jgi:hypothetical protein
LLGHLALQVGGRGILSIRLLFQLPDGALLDTDIRLQL